jgi:hypothetical protein
LPAISGTVVLEHSPRPFRDDFAQRFPQHGGVLGADPGQRRCRVCRPSAPYDDGRVANDPVRRNGAHGVRHTKRAHQHLALPVRRIRQRTLERVGAISIRAYADGDLQLRLRRRFAQLRGAHAHTELRKKRVTGDDQRRRTGSICRAHSCR